MESKAEKFTRLRLPKILHSLDILSNLSGAGYDYTEGQARDMVGVLRNDRAALWPDRAEVAWAYDALRRGDTKLAQARLKMILDATR